VYRNARKKYSDAFRESKIKDGVRGIEMFRTVKEGVLAAHKAGLCHKGVEREASALYVTVNPRDVPTALKETPAHYFKWVEHKAGTTKQQVRKGDRDDFAATLDRVLLMNILKSRSRARFQMIDVDDDDPTTWLQKIQDAIGLEAIEMIIKTKNGFHVVYSPKHMDKTSHRKLEAVLSSDPKKGQDASVTKSKGSMISCALPGGYQADHPTKILYCSCQRETEDVALSTPPVVSITGAPSAAAVREPAEESVV
jgi:hypothetical protein